MSDRMCVVCRGWFTPESNEKFCSMLCLRWYKEQEQGDWLTSTMADAERAYRELPQSARPVVVPPQAPPRYGCPNSTCEHHDVFHEPVPPYPCKVIDCKCGH